jgi:uncharacterized protein
MNPLGGGVLAESGGKGKEFLKGRGGEASYGALRYLLANAGVTAALLGFTSPEQVPVDLEALDAGAVADEPFRRELERLMDRENKSGVGFCTGCRYCEVCDHGFSPSTLMQAVRNARLYGMEDTDFKQWMSSAYETIPLEEALPRCIGCGLCELQCPQKLGIVAEIRRMKEVFGK